MTSQEAASIIRAMSASLVKNPGQFKIQVNVTGQSVVSHGGTGLSITATGGGPGSSTVGQVVSASVGDIEIRRGTEAFNAQVKTLVETLDTIAKELEAGSPDPGKIKPLHEKLLGTWVPGVITSVIGNVLSSALGI